ncbi:MAG: glycosyltransferase [Mycobacteriales bacterium]
MQVVRFAPHDVVLPSSDLAITHAGHGTVMAAAGAGVPMLCVPMGRDQNFVAARVEALGLGRMLDHSLGRDEIAAAVGSMLAQAKWKAASRAFAAGVSRFGDLQRAADLVEQAASLATTPAG